MSELVDVVAIKVMSGDCRVIASGKTPDDAEAVIAMAVARRGVDEEFYRTAPHRAARVAKHDPDVVWACAGKIADAAGRDPAMFGLKSPELDLLVALVHWCEVTAWDSAGSRGEAPPEPKREDLAVMLRQRLFGER